MDFQGILDAPPRPVDQQWGGGNPRFYRYDPSFLDAVGEKFRVFTGSPEVTTENDLIYMPQYTCLYSREGLRVDSSCSHKGPEGRLDTTATHIVRPAGRSGPPVAPPDEIVPPRKLRAIPDRCIYAGCFEEHYGHFLTQSIARLWYALKDRESLVLWHGLGQGDGSRPASFVDSCFESGVVDTNRFVSFGEPVLLREVAIPHPSFSLNREGFEAHRLLPEGVAEYWLPGDPETTSQPLYLSRRLVDQRRIIGESRLEKRLQGKGFAVVCPETLTLPQQIRLINRHEVIVGAEGSALHGVLFDVSPSRNMVCWASTGGSFRTTFLIIDAIKHVSSTYVSALRKEPRPKEAGWFKRREEPRGKRSRILDVDAAMEALRGLGLI